MMRIVCLLSVCLTGVTLHAEPVYDEKGRDIRQVAIEDSIARMNGIANENAIREAKRKFIQAMKLREFPEECIAIITRERSCLLTVEEFNSTLESRSPDSSSGSDAESIRRQRKSILSELLGRKYLSYRYSHGDKKDSLEARMREEEGAYIAQARKKTGDSVLLRIYRNYHARLFRARQEKHFLILASSDSSKLASLPFASPDSLLMRFHWQAATEAELPPGTASAAGALRPGEISKPARTPFGYVLIRLLSVENLPETPFEKALPILIELAKAPGKPTQRMNFAIYSYYQENRERFITPDTAEFRAWLVPDAKRKSGRFLRDIELRKRNGDPLEDTLGTQPMLVDQGRLPAPVFADLEPLLEYRKDEFIGPLKSEYGIWYFRTVKVSKGGRQLSLEEATPVITRELFRIKENDPVRLALESRENKRLSRSQSMSLDYLEKKFRPNQEALAALRESAVKDSLERLYAAGTPEETKQAVELGLVQAGTQRRMDMDRSQWIETELSFRILEP